jgi:Tol biopolymer transport system component
MRYSLLFLIFFTSCKEAIKETDALTEEPVIFLEGLISDGWDNRDITLSPDGHELFYTLQYENRLSVIMQLSKEGDDWGEARVAWFSGAYKDLEAAFSPDGTSLYFASNRPMLYSEKEAGDFNIWFLQKTDTGWSQPIPLDTSINTEKDEYYPSVARSGNLYFTRDNGETLEDIFVAKPEGNGYGVPFALPDAVNSKGYDFNAFIDPDERFILFTSYKREDDLGGGDMYISHRVGGEWREAQHLDASINSSSIDYCPYISPDGEWFYFTSPRVKKENLVSFNGNLQELKQQLGKAGMGSDDIYRLPASAVKQLHFPQ